MIKGKEIPQLTKVQEHVLSGSEEDISIPMTPIRDVEKELKDIGFKDLEMDGEETNGWQIDFWYKFVHPKYGKYQLSGSLHYGDFKFGKLSEQDEE